MISLLLHAALLSSPATSLESILDSHEALKGSVYSVHVSRVNGETLFDRNADLRLVPASNQKLVASLYAAHYLGMGFRPRTEIVEYERVLVVRSSGDPSMSSARLQEAGRRVQSRLKPVFVDQAFRPGIPSGWEADDLVNRYAAPVFAFTVDQGAFRLLARDGTLQPLPSELGVAVVRGSAEGPLRVDYEMASQRVVVQGALGAGTRSVETLALVAPSRSAAKFLGTGFLESAPAHLGSERQRFTIEGDPLPKLLADCLQPSDNQYAEHLLLMTAARRGKITNPANPYPAARADLSAFLTQTVGLATTDVRPMDGSGLSRHNLITTRGLGQALQWAARQPWFSTFDQALAAPGVGTLRSRLSGSTFRGKTGTLNSVVGLSGYVTRQDGERLVVSVLINHTTAPSATVRDLADSVVRWVEQTPSFGPTLVYSEGHGHHDLEASLPNPSHDSSVGHRLRGLGRHGGPSRPWIDR